MEKQYVGIEVEHAKELARTASMLAEYAGEIFPDINDQGQMHFGRVVMESAAEAIRAALASPPTIKTESLGDGPW